METIDDLVAEQERLEGILADLDDTAWESPSAAEGWTVADVVLHLAQSEEAVIVTTVGGDVEQAFRVGGATLDEVMDRKVRDERATMHSLGGREVFDRWRTAWRAAAAALRVADPRQPVQWAAAPLKPATLATTRLAEHWAHGLDITEPLGIPFPDTARLRHVAWLAHGSLPYAFTVAGEQPHDVFCALVAPDGSTWRYGPPDAASTITGSAGAVLPGRGASARARRVRARRRRTARGDRPPCAPHLRGLISRCVPRPRASCRCARAPMTATCRGATSTRRGGPTPRRRPVAVERAAPARQAVRDDEEVVDDRRRVHVVAVVHEDALLRCSRPGSRSRRRRRR